MDISKKWYSWRFAFDVAVAQNRICEMMNKEVIKIETQYLFH